MIRRLFSEEARAKRKEKARAAQTSLNAFQGRCDACGEELKFLPFAKNLVLPKLDGSNAAERFYPKCPACHTVQSWAKEAGEDEEEAR